MNPTHHSDDCPNSETVKRLVLDVWDKDDSVTKRVYKLEGHVAGILKWQTDLNGPPGSYNAGILGEMKTSLGQFKSYLEQQKTIAEQREKMESGRWWKTALGAGLILFACNILLSIIKSKLGLG